MDGQDCSPTESVEKKILGLIENDPGFAGVGASIEVISQLADDDVGDNRTLVATILRDVGLTSKLLRLANASGRGTRSVATVDQVISVLGLNMVRTVALSVSLLKGVASKQQSRQLHAEVVAAYFCGTLANSITRNNGGRFKAQESQVCGLMQNLGRVMATYYLFDELEASRYRQAEKNLTEDEAIAQSLGITFEQIGSAIANAWNLPDVLKMSLAATKGKNQPNHLANPVDWHVTCALFARRVTDILFRQPDDRERSSLTSETNFFRQGLFLKTDELQEWISWALSSTDTLLADMGFPLSVEQARITLRKASERVHDAISPQDRLAKSVGGQRAPIDRINQALRMIHAAFEYDLTVLLLPDGSAAVVAVSGIGRHANQVVPKFRCHGARADLFRLLLQKNSDMYVPNTGSPAFGKLLPEWYKLEIGASSFQLTMLRRDGKPCGMVYGDYTEARTSESRGAPPEGIQKWYDMIIEALDP